MLNSIQDRVSTDLMNCTYVILLLLVLWSVECNLITKRAQLSSKRDGVGGIQVEDLYYFAGGFEFNDLVPSKIIEIYNVTSGDWGQPILLDEGRGFISTAISEDLMFFVGGVRHPSCAMMYNMDMHQYEDIGCGSTVRTAIQISYHNDTLTVLGAFSADFFNTSKQWYYKPGLTSWMQQISGGARLVHENLIVGIGGINATTSEQLYDAWIFNTDTNELKVFNDVTTSTDKLEGATFAAASGRIVIYTANHYFVHEFGTTQWQEGFMTGISNAVLLNDYMFLINSTGTMIYNLNTMEPKWRDGAVEQVFVLETQVVLYAAKELFVYEDGQLVTTIELLDPITLGVRWGDKCVFHYAGTFLRLYDPQTKTISQLSFAPSTVDSLVPFNNATLAVFSQNLAQLYDIESDTITQVFMDMQGAHLIGTDFISFSNKRVWINLGEFVSLNLSQLVTTTFVNGPAVYGPLPKDYLYIDVLNYKTRTWQPRIPISGTTFINAGQIYLPVFVIDDMLIIGRIQQILRYNITTGAMVATRPSRQFVSFQSVSTIPVINHTGYVPVGASALLTVNSTTDTVRDDLQLTGAPKAFVAYNDTIYAAILNTLGGSFFSVSTYDFNNGLVVDSIILLKKQVSVSLAALNNTLVALGNDGSVYGMLLNDRLTWYQTPLQNDFIRPISSVMNDGTFMVAGGKHAQFSTYTDEILFINVSAVIELGTKVSINEPIASNQPDSSTPDNGGNTGLTEGELAAAIVVPVVVGIGGVIALVMILVQRRKKNKNSSSTIGLEARYGTWFIPFNQITFGEQLGQGGSGQVFKGTWNNTTIALKVSMTQANSTVIAELELMIQLRPHPNVVQLLGFSVHPETDSIILVIEFCDGGSLDTKLYDTSDEISQQEKVQWLTGIAKGLSHLHSNNIVHRDVAARNILMDKNEPKVTDFGMSRLIDEQKQHGTTKSELGPIRWMSPESLKNKEYSTKSDIWSFGILMFEVIMQQEPHINADPIEIGRLIRDSGLTPVIPSTSSCHPQLAEIMKQCWQMSPQSRPKIETIIQMLESVAAE